MRSDDARRARRALDQRLADIDVDQLAVPPRGWVRAIRDALGMPQATLSARMGLTSAATASLERSEVAGRAQLDSLRKAAHAMDCDLVYAFVPRQGLERTVREAALGRLAPHLRAVEHTMALEDQGTNIGSKTIDAEIDALIASGRVWS